jgi:hypothetical protein
VIVAVDRLETVAAADLQLEVDVLLRIAEMPPDELTLETRVEAATRATPRLLALGKSMRAYELLEGLNGLDDPRLEPLRLRAALLASRYDEADELAPGSAAWVAAFSDVIELDPTGAARVKDEIERRFEGKKGELVGDVRLEFDAAIERLQARQANAEDDASGP